MRAHACLADPALAVTNALDRLRVRRQARRIFVIFPELLALSERLASFCLEVVKTPTGELLLDRCLREACDAFLRADTKPHCEPQVAELKRIYVLALMAQSTRLMEVRVCAEVDPGEYRYWDPLRSPLTEFLKGFPTAGISVVEEHFHSVRPGMFAAAMATRVFTIADLADFRELFPDQPADAHA